MSKPASKATSSETKSSKARSAARRASPDPRRASPATPKRGHKGPELRVGTSGWHYKAWSGLFYPPEVNPKDFLSFYVQQFNTTEINNSFYRLPTEPAVQSWRDGVPEGFLFAWKASRYITHLKRLKDVGDSLKLVFGRMAGLRSNEGPALFQLPPSFHAKPENRERLARCLAQLPRRPQCTFEFRHPSWYEEDTFQLLRDHNVALCISDHEDAPAPWVATADFVYVRVHGTEGGYAGSYDRGTLKRWTRDIASWRKEKRNVYVYFDNDVKSAAPQDARVLLDLIEED